MSIQIKSYGIVGIYFSDLCCFHETSEEGYYTYLTKKLEKEIAKKFEDGKIDDKEVNPELLALVFDLDSFEFYDSTKTNSIIGIKVLETDVGDIDVSIVDFLDINMANTKVQASLDSIDSSILESTHIKFGIITQAKEVPNE